MFTVGLLGSNLLPTNQ